MSRNYTSDSKKKLKDLKFPAGLAPVNPNGEYIFATMQGRSRRRRIQSGQPMRTDEDPKVKGPSSSTPKPPTPTSNINPGKPTPTSNVNPGKTATAAKSSGDKGKKK